MCRRKTGAAAQATSCGGWPTCKGDRDRHTGVVGFYRNQALPRITDIALAGRDFGAIRRRVASGLAGDVREVGFGSGLNIPHYPPGVRRVLAVARRAGGGAAPAPGIMARMRLMTGQAWRSRLRLR
jgi:hypothetical protein